MLFQFILLQFIAHLFADFIFQPLGWSNEKSKKVFTWYHIYHVVVVFIFSYFMSFNLGFWMFALALSGVHFITDILKSFLQLRAQKNGKENNYFFVDQLIHIIALIVISCLYNYYYGINFIFEIPINVITITAGFILCAKPANIFIKYIFIAFSIETPSINKLGEQSQGNENSLPNAGKLIGIMERFLVLALILIGQFSAVGLIIAAKSILRFKSQEKNEYILVGTLLSFGIAVIIGILISKYNLLIN